MNILTKLGQASIVGPMQVNVGQAKTDLSKLLARVEAGEEVQIARDGVPVARLVRIEKDAKRGERFLATWGSAKWDTAITEDFEFSEEELDQMYAEWDEEDKLLS